MEGILALFIPIIAIVVWSPVGKAMASAIQNNTNQPEALKEISNRVEYLESKLTKQELELEKLNESVQFYEKLQSSTDSSTKQLSD